MSHSVAVTNQQDNGHKKMLETMRLHVNVRHGDEEEAGHIYNSYE